MENWYGVLAPAGLPADVRASLEKAVLGAVQSPAIAKALADGGARGATDARGFEAKLAKDVAFWGPRTEETRHLRRIRRERRADCGAGTRFADCGALRRLRMCFLRLLNLTAPFLLGLSRVE